MVALPLLVRILLILVGFGFSSWYTMRIVRSDAAIALHAGEISLEIFSRRMFGPKSFTIDVHKIDHLVPGGSHGAYFVDIVCGNERFEMKPLTSNAEDKSNFNELMTQIGRLYGYS